MLSSGKLYILVYSVIISCAMVHFIHASSGDYYSILGISRGASEKEIKKAYKAQARKWHPDKHPNKEKAQKRFVEISKAYEVLSNRVSKREYDENRRFGSHRQRHPQYHYRTYRNRDYYSHPRYSRQHYYHHAQVQNDDLLSALTSFFMYIFYGLVCVIVYQNFVDTPKSQPKKCHQESTSTNKESPVISPFKTIASSFAPSLYEFKPEYVRLRGRRTIVFFPRYTSGDIESQWETMESLAKEFKRDPVTFTWIDQQNQHKSWRTFLKNEFGATAEEIPAIVLNHNATKLVPYRGDLDREKVGAWITRLVGGEISLKPPITAEVPIFSTP